MKLKWTPVPDTVRWNKIRSLRNEKNISQSELAVRAKVSLSTIYYLESGFEGRAGEETKKKLAMFFQCDVDDLFPCDMLGNRPRTEYLESLIPKKETAD